MSPNEPPTSHTAAMVAWERLPLPLVEIAMAIAPDSVDALEREVHLATTMLCLGLATALARCRAKSIRPPAEIVDSYDDQSPGRLGWAIAQLKMAHPDVLGWNLTSPHPPAEQLRKLLGMPRGAPTVQTAIDAIKQVRNRWAHGRPLPRTRAECASALHVMLPTLAAMNSDFQQRLLRVGTSERAPSQQERWRALVMSGPAPQPYLRGQAVALPGRVEPGHVVLVDETAGTLLDLYPFVVGDESGLWVFWALENDRPVLRRGAWVITNGPPAGRSGEMDWKGRGKDADVEALRAALRDWREGDVTSIDMRFDAVTAVASTDGGNGEASADGAGEPASRVAQVAADPSRPRPGERRSSSEAPVQVALTRPASHPALERRAHSPSRRLELEGARPSAAPTFSGSEAPSLDQTPALGSPENREPGVRPDVVARDMRQLGGFVLMSGSLIGLIAVAVWALLAEPQQPRAASLPELVTGLPLRWGEPASEVDAVLGLPRSRAPECVAGIIEIRGLLGRARAPVGAITSGGLTFHRDAGLYEVTLRTDATLEESQAVLVGMLGEPAVAEPRSATWNLDDVRVRVGVRGEHAVLHVWRPTIEALYEAARGSACHGR